MFVEVSPVPSAVHARIHDALPIVDRIASALYGQVSGAVQRDDLVSAGREGLVRAAQSFQEDVGVPFTAWATLRIRGAMIDSMAQSTNVPRRVYRKLKALEAAQALAESMIGDVVPPASPERADQALESTLGLYAVAMMLRGRTGGPSRQVPDTDPSPEEVAEDRDNRDLLRRVVASLPDPDQGIIRRVYFDDPPASVEQAGKDLGLSKSWASRIHTRAVDVIRGRFLYGIPPHRARHEGP